MANYQQLTANPSLNAGYNLATNASNQYDQLNKNPWQNNVIQGTMARSLEDVARRSAGTGRFQGGNYLADSNNASLAAVTGASNAMGKQYSDAINAGSGFYQTEMNPQAQVQGANIGANATMSAANSSAQASRYNTDMQRQHFQDLLPSTNLNSISNYGDMNTRWLNGLGSIAGLSNDASYTAALQNAIAGNTAGGNATAEFLRMIGF